MVLVVLCSLFIVCMSVVSVVCVLTVTRQSERGLLLLAEWMEMTAKNQSSAVSQVAEAIGKSVQTAWAPPQPGTAVMPPLDELRQVIQDSMTRFEQPDFSDPTDGQPWLAAPRDEVVMVDPNDPEPYGIPGLRNMHLPPLPQKEPVGNGAH